jgi:glycerol-3-phosphate dehydrogenase
VIGVGAGGVTLRDGVSGAEVRVRAAAVVNAAGPHVDAVRRRLGVDGPPLVRTSRGSHLVLAPMGEVETALAAFLRDGRIQFVVPHRAAVLCGTTETDDAADGDAPGVAAADVEYLLAALGELLEVPPGRGDVRFAYAGWRALPAGRGPAGQLNREAFLHSERCAAGPLHTAVGGKLTTHRAFAERAVAGLLGDRRPSASRTEPLPGGEGPAEPGDPLWWRHGSLAPAVRALAADDPSLRAPLGEGSDLIGAEVAWAMRHQGAVSFTDLMLRRLFQVQGPLLDAESLARAFELFVRFRPRDLPALDADAEHRGFAAAVRAMTGTLAMLPDAPARSRT